jgi:hypothetical protein
MGMPYIENLDELVEEIADMCNVYGTPPEDGDHPQNCECRMCFVIGLRDRITALKEHEYEAKLAKQSAEITRLMKIIIDKEMGWTR